MLLDGGSGSRGPVKSTGTVDKLMKKPAPAKDTVRNFQANLDARWQGAVEARQSAPSTSVPRSQTANEILGIAPFVHQDDPLSYEKREAITPSAYASGRDQGTLHPEQQKMFEAHEAEDARAEREKVLGITTGALTTTPELLKEQVDRLTPEEYNALSPRQRAAVDYNTLLATAVKKDLNRQDRYAKLGDAAHDRYDKSVKQMFGEDGGSDLYAPETMAVLRQLKIGKDEAADLDDYLNLKVAITADDLKDITDGGQPAPNYAIEGRVSEGAQGKLAVVEGLVDKTQDMEASLAKGKQLMQSFLATAAAERSEDLGNLGGSSPLASRPSLGFRQPTWTQSGAPGDLNTYFMQAFDTLADPKVDKDKVLGELNQMLSPDELDAFKSYADARTRNTRYYGAQLRLGQGDSERPKQIRAILGLDKLNGEER